MTAIGRHTPTFSNTAGVRSGKWPILQNKNKDEPPPLVALPVTTICRTQPTRGRLPDLTPARFDDDCEPNYKMSINAVKPYESFDFFNTMFPWMPLLATVAV